MSRIRDVRPPDRAMRYVNPIIKAELHSPLARFLPWAELSFDGRRTGRRITVVVRMYALEPDGEPVTFSPNGWRNNFVEPRKAQWRFKGKTQERTLTLVRDFAEVATVLNRLRDQGLWVPAGLRIRKGERFTSENVSLTNTMMLRFS